MARKTSTVVRSRAADVLPSFSRSSVRKHTTRSPSTYIKPAPPSPSIMLGLDTRDSRPTPMPTREEWLKAKRFHNKTPGVVTRAASRVPDDRGVGTVSCQYCDFVTDRVAKLMKHVGEVHPTPKLTVNRTDRSAAQRTIPRFRCPMCEFGSDDVTAMQSHRVRMHKPVIDVEDDDIQCLTAPTATTAVNVGRPPTVVPVLGYNGMFACPEPSCPFTTKHKSGVGKHGVQHRWSADRSHGCPQCTTFFRKAHLMMAHERKMHHTTAPAKSVATRSATTPKVGLQKCTTCPFETKHKYTLEAHVKAHSPVGRPFKCATCPQMFFASAVGLRKHLTTDHADMLTVDASPTYRCLRAGCSFIGTTKTALVLHYSVEHEDRDVPPPPTTSSAVVHKTRGTPSSKFACAECGIAEKGKASLVRHKLKHIAVGRPFKCDRGCANIQFEKKRGLTTHLRSAIHKNSAVTVRPKPTTRAPATVRSTAVTTVEEDEIVVLSVVPPKKSIFPCLRGCKSWSANTNAKRLAHYSTAHRWIKAEPVEEVSELGQTIAASVAAPPTTAYDVAGTSTVRPTAVRQQRDVKLPYRKKFTCEQGCKTWSTTSMAALKGHYTVKHKNKSRKFAREASPPMPRPKQLADRKPRLPPKERTPPPPPVVEVTCTVCAMSMGDNVLKEHMGMHNPSQRPYKCSHTDCIRMHFRTRRELGSHNAIIRRQMKGM